MEAEETTFSLLDDLFVARGRKKVFVGLLLCLCRTLNNFPSPYPLEFKQFKQTFNDKVEITNTSNFAFILDEADGDSVPLAFDMGFGNFAFFSLRQKFIHNRLLVIYRELLAN